MLKKGMGFSRKVLNKLYETKRNVLYLLEKNKGAKVQPTESKLTQSPPLHLANAKV